MFALSSTPAARRFAIAAVIFAVASGSPGQALAGTSDETGYVERSVAAPVARARILALRKLAVPRCRQLLGEFKNLSGITLDEALTARGDTVERHIQRMVFLDGFGMSPCLQRGVYAFTRPGSLTVFFCRNFGKLAQQSPGSAANLLIHELLHSLGASEAPAPGFPTAYEITFRVDSLCGW